MELQRAGTPPSIKVKAVLFDMDGTLVDSNEAHVQSWVEVFGEFGRRVGAEQVRPQIGKGGDQLMPVFLSEEVIRNQGSAIEERRKEIFKTRYQPHLKAFPQTRELVQRLLATGCQIVLASSASEEELETNKRLARVDDLIKSATARDDVKRSKPHPDIFEAALAKLDGIPPEHAIAIGDSPYDAEAAGKAGVRCIGLLSGGFDEGWLREAGCVAIYDDVADLLAKYETSPLAQG